MGAMNLSEFGNAIRAELYCDDTVHAPTQMDRAIAKTEALLSRLIPKKAVYEGTYDASGSETLVISSNTGTLSQIPVKYDSETITSAAGVKQVRNTNYTINYMTGVVTEISANMIDGNYSATYTIDPKRIDLTTNIPNPIKITRIEYPVGDQPPTYLGSFDWMFNTLTLHGNDLLSDGRNYRIYYDSLWTAATASTDGEYPTHLDDAIIIGAAGQCLIFKAEEYVIAAVTELKLVNAAADSMATPLAAIGTALDRITGKVIDAISPLDKIPVYLETNVVGDSGVDNAKAILTRITTDTAQLRTRIDAILSKSNDFLFNTGDATDPSAKYYLVTGDEKIITVNVADRVAEKYADYARASIQIFQGLVAEATIRVNNIQTYIAEAQGWVTIANGFRDEAVQRLAVAAAFANEAAQRVAEVNAWAIQADRYRTTSQEYLNIAGRYLASGQAKINEFYVMLGFKPELAHSQASTGQATLY